MTLLKTTLARFCIVEQLAKPKLRSEIVQDKGDYKAACHLKPAEKPVKIKSPRRVIKRLRLILI